jgi:glycosyltransferase involved in cell wall biosynthesis
VIVGEGPERANIHQAALAMGIADRLHLPGFLRDPSRFIGLFDIFAMSSRSEQFPISVVEAMAAGLPVAAPPVGDVPLMVSAANQSVICPYPGEVYLRDALQKLADDADLRRSIGAANQARALAEYGEDVMIAAYAGLYGAAMGKPGMGT